MGAERAFDRDAVDSLWTGPPFGRSQHNHRPAWAIPSAAVVPGALNFANLQDHALQAISHGCMHRFRDASFHKVWLVSVTSQQLLEFLARDAGQHGGSGALISV